MNLGELVDLTKELSDDARAGLWAREYIRKYIAEAEREAAKRSRLLLDILTPSDAAGAPVCAYPVLQGEYQITLHPKTLFVRRVKLASQSLPLAPIRLEDLDCRAPEWEQHVEGTPVVFCRNWQQRRLLFYPAFAAADTVKLQIHRLPLVTPIGDSDTLEIEEQYQMGLPHWALFRLYSKPDPDTRNKMKAQDHLQLYEQQFGPVSSAIDETWLQRQHGYDQFEGIF